MNKWLLTLCLCLGLVSCSKDNGPDAPVEPEQKEAAPLTLLAYMVANNNLDDDLYVNISAMYQGLSLMDQSATLLIYWDGQSSIGPNSATHVIMKFETDGNGNVNGLPALGEESTSDEIMAMAEVVKEYPKQLSTDKDIMSKVLKDMIALAPTQRMGLIAGSHASAWTNSIFTRSFGQDGSGTDNTILLADMADAIRSTGKTFDFLLFDACYMGTIESCYEFRDVADYQLVSVMEVPAYGFPYDTDLLSHLYEGTLSGYKMACQEYIDYYTGIYGLGRQAWATISVVDSKEIEPMVSVLKDEIVAHKDALADYDTNVLQEYGRSSGPDISFDMRQLVKELNDGKVPAEFDAQLGKTVLYKDCMTDARPASYSVDAENYCGLGIYVPVSSRPEWNDFFKTLEWYTVSGWNEVTFSWDF